MTSKKMKLVNVQSLKQELESGLKIRITNTQ